MATTRARATRGAPARAPRRPALPPITVAKLEETGHLLERLIAENQSVFIAHGQRHKEAHRDGTSRPLNAAEAAQIAVAMVDAADGSDRVRLAEQLQQSSLRAYDEPDMREVLLAAGVATAPAFLRAALDVVALVEMPIDEFEDACESDTLEEAIADRARELRRLPLQAARERAARALQHYGDSAGVGVGEALRLLAGTVWQALTMAATHLAGPSGRSQLIDSAESSASTDATSSTGSAGPAQEGLPS